MTQPPVGAGSRGPGPYETPDLGQPHEPLKSRAPSRQQAGVPIDPSIARYNNRSDVDLSADRLGGEPTSSTPGSTVDAAKGEARQVADTAVGSGKEVAQTARDEAAHLAAETRQQAASLLDTVRAEIGAQAGTQQNRIANALHALSRELGSMASSSPESGPLTDLACQASQKGGEVAHWLRNREPADVLEAVRSYARRRPGTFLALCGLTGVLAGRLTRSTVATRARLDTTDEPGSGTTDRDNRRAASSRTAVPNFEAPITRPAAEPATTYTSGVYGGSADPTEPVSTAPYGSEPPVSGSGVIGGTDPVDNPSGGSLR